MAREWKKNMHPNSLANLRPVKKGEVRNPKGGSRKATERKERRSRLEEFKVRHGHGEKDPFTQDEALMWYEYLNSLTPSELSDVLKDTATPFGAIKIAKFLRTDYQEGADRNTDKMERRYYGNRESVAVQAEVASRDATISTLGFVFGGELLEREGKDDE